MAMTAMVRSTRRGTFVSVVVSEGEWYPYLAGRAMSSYAKLVEPKIVADEPLSRRFSARQVGIKRLVALWSCRT